ncbi:MAG TPA: copper amine oxidase N-terminal domain-containing protein [Clostridiaceae bacterium]|nr:copper amine oxidase N-terminal domain-containing protein [Clostridiaceae bacterium]
MKKLALSFIVCVFVVFFAVSFACAGDNIVEVPNLKIIIDGKLSELKDVPISVNQRTLLPLRELAEKLGIPNDDEHIIWNNKEKSVTITKDSLKIYLKQGSKTVYVNGDPIELDVAPVGYINSRTYIPFRFMAETLGKKVIWDGKTQSIFICDAEEFDKVKEFMDKSNEAMKAVKNYSAGMNIKMDIVQDSTRVPMDINVNLESDSAAEKMYMIMNTEIMGQEMIIEYYYDNEFVYMSNPLTNEWVKQKISEEYANGMFKQNGMYDFLNNSFNDIFYSGLRVAETDGESLIVLEGNVYLDSLFEMISKNILGTSQSDLQVTDCYIKMSFDQNTYYINDLSMQMNCNILSESGEGKMSMDLTAKYDYNRDIVVEIPEEVINNAVEMNLTEDSVVEGDAK